MPFSDWLRYSLDILLFENGVWTQKTYQMLSIPTTLEKIKNAAITGLFRLCSRKTRSGKSRDYRFQFEKYRFQIVFRLLYCDPKTKSRHLKNSSELKSGFEKLGSVWSVDLTVEVKLHFQSVDGTWDFTTLTFYKTLCY